MTSPSLGCIADDYTGAADLASMLARAGLRVIQSFGVPTEQADLNNCDAVIVALKTRSASSDYAVEASLRAMRCMQDRGVERFFFKYCSTFDSTPRGNIGPVADALAEALGCREVLFCPAYPANGRTVYCGHLFVGGVPLHESGMAHHPLTPMSDSNLIRVLTQQSNRPVSSLGLFGAPEPWEAKHYIADAIDEAAVRRVAELARAHRLLTGGAAIAKHWAEVLQLGGRSETDAETFDPREQTPAVVLAGSCSDATRAQVAAYARVYPTLKLDLNSGDATEAAASAAAWLEAQANRQVVAHRPPLICSAADTSAVTAAQNRWGRERSAALVEATFGEIAVQLARRGVRRFVVAGGETAGAVVESLGIHLVRIGREIATGVPWVHSIDPPGFHFALKSGNFGGERFFFDALEVDR